SRDRPESRGGADREPPASVADRGRHLGGADAGRTGAARGAGLGTAAGAAALAFVRGRAGRRRLGILQPGPASAAIVAGGRGPGSPALARSQPQAVRREPAPSRCGSGGAAAVRGAVELDGGWRRPGAVANGGGGPPAEPIGCRSGGGG